MRTIQQEKWQLNPSSKSGVRTLESNKTHQKQFKSLKSKLKDYDIDQVGNSSSVKEIDTSIRQGLLKALEFGDKKLLIFVKV